VAGSPARHPLPGPDTPTPEHHRPLDGDLDSKHGHRVLAAAWFAQPVVQYPRGLRSRCGGPPDYTPGRPSSHFRRRAVSIPTKEEQARDRSRRYVTAGRSASVLPPADAPGSVQVPRLADGVELLGEYPRPETSPPSGKEAPMPAVPDMTIQDLDLEHAELLPARETLWVPSPTRACIRRVPSTSWGVPSPPGIKASRGGPVSGLRKPGRGPFSSGAGCCPVRRRR
jgi:hypothetical protein